MTLIKIHAGASGVEAALGKYKGVRLCPVRKNGVLPRSFYATTNYPTEVFFRGKWLAVAHTKMDCAIVVDEISGQAECRKMAFVKVGEKIVVGNNGVRIIKEGAKAEKSAVFGFMGSAVSSEKDTFATIKRLAVEMREIKSRGGRIVIIAGPAVVHTGAAEALAGLIAKGYVSALLTGNALAVHDIENAIFRTSLGEATERGRANHLRAINRIREVGSIEAAVDQGIVTSGIMLALVRHHVPYVLAGSIRDDGPLPDTITDVMVAQKQMSQLLEHTDLALMIATMLHSIAAGNLMPATTKTVCVDMTPGVVTKLMDRGTHQAIGVVTDVSLFLRTLNQELSKND